MIDLAEMVIDAMGQQVEIKFCDQLNGEVRHTHCNIQKATRDFGFRPDTSLKEAIQATVEWHRATS